MTTPTQLRNRYAQDSVGTASPAQLLVMLYDRLNKDLMMAEHATKANDVPMAHENLVHAQEIITELATTLDTSVWEGGEQLRLIYEFCNDELLRANVDKDTKRIQGVRRVIDPLRDAWHQAARMVGEAS